MLNEVGGDSIGSADGTDYFTISVDADTGEITLTLHDNLWQPDASNPDDAQTLVLNADTLSLIKTMTDADGDTVWPDFGEDPSTNNQFRDDFLTNVEVRQSPLKRINQ